MTIPEAIEILESDLYPDTPVTLWDAADSIRLGIEALKHIKETRLYMTKDNYVPLPRETEG